MINRLYIVLFILLNSLWASAQKNAVHTRLDRVQMTVPLTYNEYVEGAINRYLRNSQNETAILLGKSELHLGELEDSFKGNKLPLELRYLASALSSYDNWLVSDDGGSGIWQMRYLTAKQYGLNISSYVDERRDISKSTSVSIAYLKELYKIYGDWQLTIAAFYSDEVEVNKAIRMAGGEKSYWKIHPFLPNRFQRVVPEFIASVYIHSFYQMHNITPVKVDVVPAEKVEIQQWTTIYQVSRALEMDFDQLKDMNAIYKKQVIPHTNRVYYLSIPFEKVQRFYTLGDSVYTFGVMSIEEAEKQPEQGEIAQPQVTEPEASSAATTSSRTLYYTVKKGDYLGKIADLYDVNISDLRRWNGIKGDRININQRLKIHVSSGKYDRYSKINSMSAYQKQQLINKD